MNHTLSKSEARLRAAEPSLAHPDWKAAIWAGVIAALVFMMAEMMLVWLVQGMSPWGPRVSGR